MWMGGWQRKLRGREIQVVAIQETHVSSEAEARSLEKLWASMWGLQVNDQRPLSFWSVTAERAAGVGFLIHPDSELLWKRTGVDPVDGRLLVMESNEWTVANIYAPNDKGTRETFFTKLRGGLPAGRHERVVMLGDFNCVMHPPTDRITNGQWSAGICESNVLMDLVVEYGLVDVWTGLSMGPDPGITYWQGEHGARLDRCYVNSAAAPWVTDTELLSPAAATDHQGMVTWLRDPRLRPLAQPQKPLAYPLYGRFQDQLDSEIRHALEHCMHYSTVQQLGWDVTVEHIKDMLAAIKQRERRRAARAAKQRERRLRRRVVTVQDAIDYEQGRTARQLARRRGRRLENGEDPATTLFRRLQAHKPSFITTIASQDGSSHEELSVANAMAREWAALLGRRHASVAFEDVTTTAEQLFTIPDHLRVRASDNQQLLATITTTEVVETIKNLGQHKAAGGDRLNNDFYRDWYDTMAPRLAAEFNLILEGNAMPESFKEAIVVPLPKNGDSSAAMDYRPISLLQSSYKIFTKLIAHRLQASLGTIINADQNGFVRGRDMANNIRLMQAILEQDYDDPELAVLVDEVAVVLLLDFKKAYDTLDRAFLLHALRVFGYDERFCALVARLHDGTTARFLVNGDLSDVIEVITGIRQGCPLAPLLFLIAVETLKHAIDQTPGIIGIELATACKTFLHAFSAFVDDSVIFLQHGRMLSLVQVTLDRFAAVSGLQVQPPKSHVLLLTSQATTVSQVGEFPVVAAGATVRYLGVEIGIADLREVNWAVRVKKLRANLGIASQFTTGLLDRVAVLNAIGIPSLLFTAKYFTPSPIVLKELDALWRQYLWKGTISSTPLRAHKLAVDILVLPTDEMGLGLHDFREAMIRQAAKSVLEWNTRPQDKYWAAFNLLLARRLGRAAMTIVHTFPSATANTRDRTVTGKTDLLVLGWQRINATMSAAMSPSPALRQLKATVLAEMASPWRGLQWLTSRKGQVRIATPEEAQWTQLGLRTYAAMPAEIRTFWATFPWADNVWITGADGQPLKPCEFPFIKITTVGELQLTRMGSGSITFIDPTTGAATLKKKSLEKLAYWLRIVIASCAWVPGDSEAAANNRVYSINMPPVFSNYEWTLTSERTIVGRALDQKWGLVPQGEEGPDSITACCAGWGRPVTFTAAHGSTRATRELSELQNRRAPTVLLAAHPRIQHGPVMQPARPRFHRALTRRDLHRCFKAYVEPGRRRRHRGLTKVLARLVHHHPPMTATHALLAVTPRQFWQHQVGVTRYQKAFRYRMLVGALNLRDDVGEVMVCPHDWCTRDSPLTIDHVVWECPAAQAVWKTVLTSWTGWQQPDVLTTTQERQCLGHSSPLLRRRFRRELHDLCADDMIQQEVIKSCWSIIQHIIPHQLWLMRNTAAFQGEHFAYHEIVPTILATIRNQLTAWHTHEVSQPDSIHRGRGSRKLMTLFLQASDPATHDPGEIRLYYDGGARGNPGPAGAGCVIVERSGPSIEWTVVWWEFEFMGMQGTNNAAEHRALANGLVECARRYKHAHKTVHIVGDSQLVTRQLQGTVRIRDPKFADSVKRSNVALRDLRDFDFHHTRRAGNKMADALANMAMDSRSSGHGDGVTQDPPTNVLKALENDTAFPWTTSFAAAMTESLQQRLSIPSDPVHEDTTNKRPRPHPDIQYSDSDPKRRIE